MLKVESRCLTFPKFRELENAIYLQQGALRHRNVLRCQCPKKGNSGIFSTEVTFRTEDHKCETSRELISTVREVSKKKLRGKT